jgi:hypothetical protein
VQHRFDIYLGIAAGVAAPLVYAGAVIAGGLATPGYSHLSSTISELTIAGQPYASDLDDVFVAYNLLLACFAASLPASFRAPRQPALRAVSVVLLALAVAGVGMVTVFPVGAPGSPLTPAVLMHTALAAVASLATMVALALTAYAVWPDKRWHAFSRFSLICFAIVLAAGIWTAAAITAGWQHAGLAERVTIGTFMVWLLIFALGISRSTSAAGGS